MRLPLIVASLLFSLVLSPAAGAAAGHAKKPLSSRKLGVSIHVAGGGWGKASKEEIETVLYAVADELLTHVPKKLTTPIVVTHTSGSPMALYDKGPGGEYQVRLHARDRRWPEYVYEFAHELCHIMSNYEEHVGADTTKYNQWFEETLCETASLHTLMSVAETWESDAPAPELARQAPRMRAFAEELVSESHRQLPSHVPLAAWLAEHREELRNNPYLRQKNEVVANLLLPLFARNPEAWDTLSYMNLGPDDARTSLERYLRNWYGNAPEEHKAFLGEVLMLLGLEDVDGVPAPSAPATRVAGVTEAPLGQTGPIPPRRAPPQR